MSNLLIVAHPDDEAIFAFSLLDQNTHVVSMTGYRRETRSEFQQVATALGFTWEMFDFDDSWDGTFDTAAIAQLVPILAREYDRVYTHNARGEYGHTQHQVLHTIVSGLVSQNLFVFGEDLRPLPFDALKTKLNVLSFYRKHAELGLWEWKSQTNPEEYMMKYVTSEGFRRIK
jgi:LmbE family N-acetylglucosaminyl deacetylase